MKFESKVLILFSITIGIVIYMGAGNLSFEEARLKASQDEVFLNSSQLQKLAEIKKQFAGVAIAGCMESTGSESEDLSVVVELGADGSVARSWRQGDSRFIVCIQKSLTDNFIFRSGKKKLIFEYIHVN